MEIKNFNLDEIDFKVIASLMEQGRMTWSELGEILNLSAPAAADRVRRLEDRGVIKGYTAVVDPAAVRFEVLAFIYITLQHPDDRLHFLRQVRELPEVLECHHVAGEEDYLLKVRCARIKDLEHLVSEVIKGVAGVARTKTTIVLSTAKETSLLPLRF